MSKIIINNESEYSEELILRAVISVINRGRISNDGKSYCYVTGFKIEDGGKVYVSAKRNKASDTFLAYEVD